MNKTLEFRWGGLFCGKVNADNADDFERLLDKQGVTDGDIEIRETTHKSPSECTIRLIAKMSVDTWRRHFLAGALKVSGLSNVGS